MPGRPLTLLLGPAEERRIPLFSSRLHDRDIKVEVNPESDRLVPLLEEASVYMGEDSGVTHLAAFLGTPTMALFRSSSVHQWRPLGPCVRVIQAEAASPTLVADVLEWAASMTGDAIKNRPSKCAAKDLNSC